MTGVNQGADRWRNTNPKKQADFFFLADKLRMLRFVSM
ncbi:unnamed protein product [Acidocella sp. C78]|nr:unnamed protein product [Acidocella sp. C78]